MKIRLPRILLIAGSALMSIGAFAQETDTTQTATVITLDDALKIALSENASVRVADMEIERTGYARKGTYASLFPQIDLTGSFQRTIKKQVMYMDMDMSSIMGGGDEAGAGDGTSDGTGSEAGSGEGAPSFGGGGIEVGRWN